MLLGERINVPYFSLIFLCVSLLDTSFSLDGSAMEILENEDEDDDAALDTHQ
jgi:hypothetical protein